MHVPLIAQQSLLYDEKRYAVGDPFTALCESDARVLTLLGKARAPASTEAKRMTKEWEATDFVVPAPQQEAVPIEPETSESTPETDTPPRRRRRTLTAEATEG